MKISNKQITAFTLASVITITGTLGHILSRKENEVSSSYSSFLLNDLDNNITYNDQKDSIKINYSDGILSVNNTTTSTGSVISQHIELQVNKDEATIISKELIASAMRLETFDKEKYLPFIRYISYEKDNENVWINNKYKVNEDGSVSDYNQVDEYTYYEDGTCKNYKSTITQNGEITNNYEFRNSNGQGYFIYIYMKDEEDIEENYQTVTKTIVDGKESKINEVLTFKNGNFVDKKIYEFFPSDGVSSRESVSEYDENDNLILKQDRIYYHHNPELSEIIYYIIDENGNIIGTDSYHLGEDTEELKESYTRSYTRN